MGVEMGYGEAGKSSSWNAWANRLCESYGHAPDQVRRIVLIFDSTPDGFGLDILIEPWSMDKAFQGLGVHIKPEKEI